MSLYGDTTLHAENRFTSFSVGLDEGFLTTVGFAADADPSRTGRRRASACGMSR